MDPPVSDGWSVGVVVPARDEADRVEACLSSLRTTLRASLRDGSCREARIVVVADRCHDDTASVARGALGPWDEVVEVDDGNVGAARRRGTCRLLELLGHGGRAASARTWLLTTDADTVVPVDWVGAHLRLADAGAAGVAGVVRVDTFADHAVHADAIRRRFDHTYASHPDGTHPHVHGANLGVRADAYLAAGGWPTLATAEDHALWARLRADGWPTVSSIEAWVTTSGRRTGRAPLGFAGHLADLAPAVGYPNGGSEDLADPPDRIRVSDLVADVVDLAAAATPS